MIEHELGPIGLVLAPAFLNVLLIIQAANRLVREGAAETPDHPGLRGRERLKHLMENTDRVASLLLQRQFHPEVRIVAWDQKRTQCVGDELSIAVFDCFSNYQRSQPFVELIAGQPPRE